MKLLLNEQLPHRLMHRLIEHHDAVTVQYMGWQGKQNGELLALLQEYQFEAFLTADKRMRHEQNWHNYPIPVIFLDVADLRYDSFKLLLPPLA